MLFLVSLIVRAVARVLVLPGAADGTKDLEVLVLRQQLRVLRRKAGRPRFITLDRVLLAAASRVLPRDRWVMLLVTPQLLRWDPELVRSKWTYPRTEKPRRPPIDLEVSGLIMRMARENPRWGCLRIQGELRKLGIRMGATTIRTLLRARGLGPPPTRSGSTWSEFLRTQAWGIMACNFFNLETVQLKTLHVLFCIEVGTSRVHLAGVTNRPDSAWVTQQGRNPAMDLDDQQAVPKFLIRDRDLKFSGGFDEVLRARGDPGDPGDPDTGPGSQGQRVRRAVGGDRAGRVPGLDARARPQAPRVAPSNLRRPLQQAEAAMRPRPGLPEPPPREPVPVHPDEVWRRDLLAGFIDEYRGDRGMTARAGARRPR